MTESSWHTPTNTDGYPRLSDHTSALLISLHFGSLYQPTLRLYLPAYIHLYLSDYTPILLTTLHSSCTYHLQTALIIGLNFGCNYRPKLRFHLSVSQFPVPCQKVSVHQGTARRTHLMLLLYSRNMYCLDRDRYALKCFIPISRLTENPTAWLTAWPSE